MPASTTPPAAEQRPLGATGVPIDPTQKTVVVVVPPGQAQSPEQQLVQLQAEHNKVEARLSRLIKNYSTHVDNARSKAKLNADMARDLDVYKRQSLELFKAQQAKQAQEEIADSGS